MRTCSCVYMYEYACVHVHMCIHGCVLVQRRGHMCMSTYMCVHTGRNQLWGSDVLDPADFGSWPPMGMGELLYLSLLLRRDSVQGPRCCHFCPPAPPHPPPLLQITRKISAWKRWAFGGHTGRRCCSQLPLFRVHVALACFKLIICHHWVFSAQPDCSKRLL